MTSTDLAPAELRILVAVADEGAFSRAADALGLTQSAISHSVRGSEAKLGAVLFDRDRSGAQPTTAGRRVVSYARRILRLGDLMRAESASGRDVVTGPVRVVAFRSAAVHLLPGALAALRRQHPGIEPEVRVVPDVGEGTAGEVRVGRADLALATLGDASVPPGLVGAVLAEEAYSLVHPVGHPAPRTLPLVDWTENCGSYTSAWWARQDWIPRASFRAEDDGTVLSMVGAGLGMAIMPALSLREAPDTVDIVDLGPDRPVRSIGYVTTPELAGSAPVRALIRALRGVQVS